MGDRNKCIKLLSRADDFGSARCANSAIIEGLKSTQVVRNVSCMAVGAFIEEGAEELKRYKDIDVGVHLTITSEWSGMRWGPLSDEGRKAGVTEEDGTFARTREQLIKLNPDIPRIIKEYSRQLDLLTKMGLKIVYADSHMMPETVIPGLAEAIREWSSNKGLLNAEEYYKLADAPIPVYSEKDEGYLENVCEWLSQLKNGEQYFYLIHPAKKDYELMLFYNSQNSPGIICHQRNQEYIAMVSPKWNEWEKKYQLKFIRYTEAKKQKNGWSELKKIISADKSELREE